MTTGDWIAAALSVLLTVAGFAGWLSLVRRLDGHDRRIDLLDERLGALREWLVETVRHRR